MSVRATGPRARVSVRAIARERQDGRAAAAAGAGAAAGAAAGAGARRDREGGGGARGDQRTQAEAKLKARTDGQGGNLHAAGERRPATADRPRPKSDSALKPGGSGRSKTAKATDRGATSRKQVIGRGEGAGAVGLEAEGSVEAEGGFEAEGSDGAEGSATQALGQQFGVQEAAEERLARELGQEPWKPQRREPQRRGQEAMRR